MAIEPKSWYELDTVIVIKRFHIQFSTAIGDLGLG